MDRRRILIDLIHIADNRRPVDDEKVRKLADSIKEVGLLNPPAVRIVETMVIDGEEEGGVPVLIHGRHRIQALKLLGRTEVECSVHDVDDDDARLMEIDENIQRNEVVEPELGILFTERKRIYERKHPETRPTSEGGGGRNNATRRQIGDDIAPRFTANTAASTGKSERVIQRSIQRVEELGEDNAKAIMGTSLAKGVEMDALIKLPEPERKELIERAVAGEAVSARANTQPTPTHDADLEAAVAILDRYGEADMPFLMPHLKPKIAAAIRDLMAA